LEAAPIDVLIADIAVPGGANGLAMSRMARMRHHSLKTIYVTGYNLGDIEAETDGAILRKPVADDRLLSAVRDALDA
jgi:DNA-binding NtrC family response regulator